MVDHSIPSAKRPRAPSSPSSALSTSPGSADPPFKASRIIHFPRDGSGAFGLNGGGESSTNGQNNIAVPSPPLLCTLPPTCNHRPAPIANSADLERHYAKYHAHVCEEQNCGCVFPEARLLALHQTECHDPLAQIRKERGDKIFQCHIPAPMCGRDFLTPKARRLHLIQAHKYPKEYFFAVTNKGIGGLLKKWGEGASMVRKEWKPRDPGAAPSYGAAHRGDADDRMDEDDDGGDDDDAAGSSDDEDNSSEDRPFNEDEEDDEQTDMQATPRMLPRTAELHSPPDALLSSERNPSTPRRKAPAAGSSDVDGLANSLDSLALVPNAIRFGRGGKVGGFANAPRARGRGRGRGRGDMPVAPGRGGAVSSVPTPSVVAQQHGEIPFRANSRGRGARGRARGPNVRGRGPTRGRGE